jgi:hypothetical protein
MSPRNSTYTPQPITQYPLQPGAKTPQESALLAQQNANKQQIAANSMKTSGGRRRHNTRRRKHKTNKKHYKKKYNTKRHKKRRTRKTRRKKGGSARRGEIVVPQANSGPVSQSPHDANSTSAQSNQTLADAHENKKYDDLVGKTGGSNRLLRTDTMSPTPDGSMFRVYRKGGSKYKKTIKHKKHTK